MSMGGLFVQCHAWAPKQQNRQHSVSRVHCALMTKPYCRQCPNSNFILDVPMQLGNQSVACPRWESIADRLKGKSPSQYVTIPRSTCITIAPFEYCSSCPNSRSENYPLSRDGWYDKQKKRKRDNP